MKSLSFNNQRLFIKTNSTAICFLLIIVAATLLRFYQIELNGIWVDESNTIIIAQKNIGGINDALANDASPPLFYSILHFWMMIFGQSEYSVRSLSAIFGIILTGVIFIAGSDLFNRKIGLFSAIICATAPLQIMYSQQCRMYSLLPLTGLLAMYFFIKFIKKNNYSYFFWYVFFIICTIFTHHYGFLLIPVQFILILFLGPKKIKVPLITIILIGAVFRYKLWLPKIIGLFLPQKPGTVGWMDFFWNKYGFFGSQFKSFESFVPGGPLPPYVAMNSLPWQPLIPVFFCILLIVPAVKPYIFSKTHTQHEKESTFWVLIYAFIPLFCAAVYSLLFKPSYLAGRCDQIVFPAFCLIFASGIYYLKNTYAQSVAIIIMLAFSFFTLNTHYSVDYLPGDRLIANTVRENLKTGDAVICTSLTRASLEYYLRDKKDSIKFYSFPIENARHLAWHNPLSSLKNPEMLKRNVKEIDETINNKKNGTGRIILIFERHPVNAPLMNFYKTKNSLFDIKASNWIPQAGTNIKAKVFVLDPVMVSADPYL